MAWVINETKDRVLGRRVEIAYGFLRRLRGLIGRSGWGTIDGLWLEPCVGVHALGMGFPIDVILVNDGLCVVWVQTLSPWRVGKLHLDARAALEVPDGTLAETGVEIGDQLVLHTTRPIGIRAS